LPEDVLLTGAKFIVVLSDGWGYHIVEGKFVLVAGLILACGLQG